MFGATWLAPGYLWGAGGAVAIVTALHFLAWRRPVPRALPTARFIPDQPVRAVARVIRPSDLLLLALRVAIVLLIGAALARPVLSPRREGSARVVVLDRSRAVADVRAAAERGATLLRSGDALVLFDSVAHTVASGGLDTLRVLSGRSHARGSLSAALIAAQREAARLARTHASVTIALVSPIAREELDEATLAVRALWPDSIALVRVPAVAEQPSSRVSVVAAAGDPLAVVAPRGRVGGDTARAAALVEVRVVRRAPDASDSAWAHEAGHVLVYWDSVAAESARGAASNVVYAEASPDEGAVTVVAPFARGTLPPGGRAIAWWGDGEPVASEMSSGDGCVRRVAVGVPREGDVALTARFGRLFAALTAPCGAPFAFDPAPDSLVARLQSAPEGGARTAGARVVAAAQSGTAAARAETPTPLTVWLLGSALVLVLAEPLARRSVA